MRLDKSTHQYFSPSGEEYLSVSAMLALAWPFNADEVAAKEAVRPESIYYGMTPADILADWDDRRDGGTELHAAIEHYVKTGQHVSPQHPGYIGAKAFGDGACSAGIGGKLTSETIVRSDRYKLAGTCDLMDEYVELSSIAVLDIKTSRSMSESKWLKYSVQMELYRMMIAETFDSLLDVQVGGILWFKDYSRNPGGFTLLPPLPCQNELQWVLNMRKKMLQ